jgi:hypothetical protein
MIIKCRCVKIANSAIQRQEEMALLGKTIPTFKFEEWENDHPWAKNDVIEASKYPIAAKNLDGSEISNEELESLTLVVNQIMLAHS